METNLITLCNDCHAFHAIVVGFSTGHHILAAWSPQNACLIQGTVTQQLRHRGGAELARALRVARQQGLRPIQIWVPDMRSPAFAAEAHRQSLAVANSPHAKRDQAFIDAVSDWGAE